MKLEFLPHETGVSPPWNWSFSPMELEFHPHETKKGDPPTVNLPLVVVWIDGLDEAGVRV